MSIKILVAGVSEETGELLKSLLREQGVRIVSSNPGGTVSYGCRLEGVSGPTLNGKVGAFDKLQAFNRFVGANFPTPTIITRAEDYPPNTGPLLMRKLSHHGGEGLALVATPQEFTWRLQAGWAYGMPILPIEREFRVWSYRGRLLAVYENTMRHPEEFTTLFPRRNSGFGFMSEFRPQGRVPEEIVTLGCSAPAVLGLDFGGTDLIISRGRPYLLEVNAAPGSDGPRQGIQLLAEKIARWEHLGFPQRRGSQNAI